MRKSPLASKTIWVNVITLVVTLAAAAQGQDWIAQNPQVTAILGAVIGGLNIALRFITSKPIK